MTKTVLHSIATLRVLVGYLGEQAQFAWWLSSFFSPSSRAFLAPVFAKTTFMTQYFGVKEAAAKVHDEHIGVGNVYHLFRLPEGIEQELYQLLQQQNFCTDLLEKIKDRNTAKKNLADLGGHPKDVREGPVHLGNTDALRNAKTWHLTAAYYNASFENGGNIYPYLSGDK